MALDHFETNYDFTIVIVAQFKPIWNVTFSMFFGLAFLADSSAIFSYQSCVNKFICSHVPKWAHVRGIERSCSSEKLFDITYFAGNFFRLLAGRAKTG